MTEEQKENFNALLEKAHENLAKQADKRKEDALIKVGVGCAFVIVKFIVYASIVAIAVKLLFF